MTRGIPDMLKEMQKYWAQELKKYERRDKPTASDKQFLTPGSEEEDNEK